MKVTEEKIREICRVHDRHDLLLNKELFFSCLAEAYVPEMKYDCKSLEWAWNIGIGVFIEKKIRSKPFSEREFKKNFFHYYLEHCNNPTGFENLYLLCSVFIEPERKRQSRKTFVIIGLSLFLCIILSSFMFYKKSVKNELIKKIDNELNKIYQNAQIERASSSFNIFTNSISCTYIFTQKHLYCENVGILQVNNIDLSNDEEDILNINYLLYRSNWIVDGKYELVDTYNMDNKFQILVYSDNTEIRSEFSQYNSIEKENGECIIDEYFPYLLISGVCDGNRLQLIFYPDELNGDINGKKVDVNSIDRTIEFITSNTRQE